MKTLGGSRSKKRKARRACVAACLTLFGLNSAAFARVAASLPITEPSNAPGAAATTTVAATAPPTLALPSGTVAVPPLTGQTATLDPNDPGAAGFDSNSDIANYERFQNPGSFQSQLPVQQFMNDQLLLREESIHPWWSEGGAD